MNEIAIIISFRKYLKKRDEGIIKFLKKYWPKFITANMITSSKFLLLPPIIFLLLVEPPQYFIEALLLIVISGAMDMLDGPVARAMNDESELGKFLDPLADKLTVLIPLWASGFYRLDFWAFIIVIILTIMETFLILKRISNMMGMKIGDNDIRAGLAGKIKNYGEFIGVFFLLYSWHLEMMNGVFVGEVILGICCFLAILSFGGHFVKIEK